MKYIIALVLCCTITHAQERLDEVVVSDSRIPKLRKNSGKAVVKITAKDIEKNKGISLAQLLNQYAGIYISGAQLHPGQNLSTFIRGGNNRQVLVRIDGVLVSDPSQIESEFDLRLVSLQQIESIEVVKGASSSLYGSGAATALIDITTKQTASKQSRIRVAQEWATQNSQNKKLESLSNAQRQYVQVQHSVAKVGLSAGVSRFTSDGMSSVLGSETDAVQKENIQFNAKSQYEGPWAWSAFFHKDVIDADYDTTYPTYADASNVLLSKQRRYGVSPSFTKGKSSFQAHISWSDSERDFTSDYPITYTSKIVTSEVTWRYSPFERITILSGGLLQDIRSSSHDAFSSQSFQHDNVAVFVSANWKHPKGYALQLSGRNTVHSAFGSHQTYTINPFYVRSFDSGSYIKIFHSWATSFIAPSQYKMFDPYYGNIALAPEENYTIESGIEYISQNSRVTLVGFQRKENNLVEFVSLPNFAGQYRNSDVRYKVRGLEVEGNITVSKWNISANYTWVEKVSQEPLRLPKHLANVGVGYSTSRLNLGAHVRHVGVRKDQNFATGDVVDLDDFTLVDMGLNVPNIIGSATATIALINVFDTSYTEFYGFTTLGRNVNIGIEYNF